MQSVGQVLAGTYVAAASFFALEDVKIKHGLSTRGDRIRTCDLVVPNHALYQAKLRPGRPDHATMNERPHLFYRRNFARRICTGPAIGAESPAGICGELSHV